MYIVRTLAFLILFLKSASSQTVSVGESTYTGVKGGTVILTCDYQLTEDLFAVRWYMYRNNNDVLIARRTVGGAVYEETPLKDRLAISSFSPSSTGRTTLTISNIQCSDETKFECGVFDTSAKELKANTELITTAPPLGNPTLPPPSGEIASGDQITLTCSGNLGRPATNFTWSKTLPGQSATALTGTTYSAHTDAGDGCTKNGDTTLQVTLTPEDNGATYTCGVQDASPAVESSTTLNVQFPVTAAQVFTPQGTFTFTIGADVTFTCSANSSPAATYKWYFMSSSTAEEDLGTTTQEYRRQNIQLDHAGTYRCEASNVVKGVTHAANASATIAVAEPTTTVATTEPPIPETTQASSKVTQDKQSPGPTQSNTGGSQQAGLEDGALAAIIVVSIVCVIVLVIVVIVCYRRKQKNKEPELGMPREKHQNQYGADFPRQPDVLDNSQGYPEYDSVQKPRPNPRDQNVENLVYADLALDDTPRSRKPIQTVMHETEYAEIRRA